ncbi:MAG: transcriptional regulator, PadR-like family [Firmicutes bacterium]|nr:transcriptional regulator, PadR-like family [Bacillota bacterium]
MGRRILKYAILGLLSKQEMSGYDIAAEFQKAIGQFWSAKQSQIYVELKKLLEEALISQHIDRSSVRIEKKNYKLTAAGKEALQTWLLAIDHSIETEKDVFVLKIYFLKHIPKEDIPFLFKNQLKLRMEKLSYLKKQFTLHFSGNKNPYDLDTEELTDYLILTKAISREESYICWLNKSFDLIK